MVRILYFGRLSDVTGTLEETIALPDAISDSRDLRAWLDQRWSAAGTLLEPTVRVAIDGCVVIDPAPIGHAQEIALMPPVGGG